MKTILSQCIFFYKKILHAQKHSSKNQLTKQKQTNTKQQKQQFFAHTNS